MLKITYLKKAEYILLDLKKQMIEKRLYKKISKVMPIATVDAIVRYKNKFILFRRTSEPNKGKMFFFGGRILKGEKILKALYRKAKEETGLKKSDITAITLWGIRSILEKRWGINTHSVSILFIIQINKLPEIIKKEFTEYKVYNKFQDFPKFIYKLIMGYVR